MCLLYVYGNTARSKSNPLMCTHGDSYMFNTVHPLGLHTDNHHLLHCDKYAFLVDLDLAVVLEF